MRAAISASAHFLVLHEKAKVFLASQGHGLISCSEGESDDVTVAAVWLKKSFNAETAAGGVASLLSSILVAKRAVVVQ